MEVSDEMIDQLRKQVGKLFVVGFDGLTINEQVKSLIHEYHVGGIILFARNLANPEQIRQLTSDLQAEAQAAGYEQPLLIAIDQENGSVKRVPRQYMEYPGAMAIGATEQPSRAFDVAKATGEDLLTLGINWNLAPVLDVNNNPDNPVINVRSFGEDPTKVAAFATAAIQGYQASGIVHSVKHFPGHGDTSVDSHLALPHVPHGRERLFEVELKPFIEAIHHNVDSIMTTHIVFDALEIDGQTPATLSSAVMTDLLREELGYQGVVVSDCLEMRAISTTFGVSVAAVRALQAGVDMLIVSHTYEEQIQALEQVYQAAEAGQITTERLTTAQSRIQDLIERRNITFTVDYSSESFFTEEKQALARDIYHQSVTEVVAGQSIPTDTAVFVIDVIDHHDTVAEDTQDGESLLFRQAQTIFSQVETAVVDEQAFDESTLREQVDQAEAVIIGVKSLADGSAFAELISQIAQHVPVYLIGLKQPYVGRQFQHIERWINTYENSAEAVKTALEAIVGRRELEGVSPVRVEE